MSRTAQNVLILFLVALFLTGCSIATKSVLAPNDEVLNYELPYDLTYLRVLDALNDETDWQVEQTDKEKGMIVARNVNYSRLNDADRRVIAFMVKRVDADNTSVYIEKDSQRIIGGKQLLQKINEVLSREL